MKLSALNLMVDFILKANSHFHGFKVRDYKVVEVFDISVCVFSQFEAEEQRGFEGSQD